MGLNSEKSSSKILGSIFALLKTGQSALVVTPSTRSFVFCFASSIEIFSSNSTSIIEKSSDEVDLISTKFLTLFKASSKGIVINLSISSAVLPG